MGDHIDSYVDEAGDPTLFGRRRGRGVIVGKEGCSKFFIIRKLEVDDPATLSKKLTELRNELLADPYFAGVGSFKQIGINQPEGFTPTMIYPKSVTEYSVSSVTSAQTFGSTPWLPTKP